jgi:DNA-binding winged helix-turn-helix (wHTH) protein
MEFHSFRLDTVNQCLWRRRDAGDDERILLRPKAYGVLRYLVEHAGRLVTEAELLEAVWPGVQPSSRYRASRLTTFCRSIDGQLLAYSVEKLENAPAAFSLPN